MKTKTLLIAGLAMLTNIAFAQQVNAPMRGQGRGIVKVLKLTEEQEKKFQELNSIHQKEVVDVKAKIQKNQIELKSMLQSGNVDDKKLLQLTGDNSKLQAELKEMGIKKWIEINKMLDKDQKEIWAKQLLRIGAGMKMAQERVKATGKRMMIHRRMNNCQRK